MINCKQRVIAREKLEEYLLSSTHLVGRAKAKFFRHFGFNESNLERLETGLLLISTAGDVKDRLQTPYGTKFVIEGMLDTPVGNRVKIRTVWMLESKEDVLRFLTAYPAR